MVNRRMRTRMYGGVRGGASDDLAYSIRSVSREEAIRSRFAFPHPLTKEQRPLSWSLYCESKSDCVGEVTIMRTHRLFRIILAVAALAVLGGSAQAQARTGAGRQVIPKPPVPA